MDRLKKLKVCLALIVCVFIAVRRGRLWPPIPSRSAVCCRSPVPMPHWETTSRRAPSWLRTSTTSRGGVLGKQVEILVRDSQLNGGVALRKAKELQFDQKVDFLAGTLSGAVSKVVNEYSAKNKIIFMGYCQSDMVTGEDINKYGFTGMYSPYMCAMGDREVCL